MPPDGNSNFDEMLEFGRPMRTSASDMMNRMLMIEQDVFKAHHERRISADDPYYRTVSAGWSEALKKALHNLPDYEISYVRFQEPST